MNNFIKSPWQETLNPMKHHILRIPWSPHYPNGPVHLAPPRISSQVALVHTDLDRETEEVIADTLQVGPGTGWGWEYCRFRKRFIDGTYLRAYGQGLFSREYPDWSWEFPIWYPLHQLWWPWLVVNVWWQLGIHHFNNPKKQWGI